MPTYEYVCEKCGHAFDFVQSMSAKPLRTCPEDVCPRKKWAKGIVKKQMSAGAGLLFKGTGFYITDYRSQNYKDSAKKDSNAASGASTPAAPAAAPAATPAAKSEAKAPASPPKKESKPKPGGS